MMIPSNYEINVATPSDRNAKYGRHYCLIELGEVLPDEAIEKFRFIKGIFPDDWNITLHEITCYGREVKVDEM